VHRLANNLGRDRYAKTLTHRQVRIRCLFYGDTMSQKLPSLSSRDIVRALAKVGFTIIPGRGKGSHEFVYRADPPTGITIPRTKAVKRGTLRGIIRQAGLTVEQFANLL
jgi:predicted RNA binding protein YcfA (HicA-like mRNA interferase family)